MQVPAIETFTMWLTNPDLPDDLILKHCLEQFQIGEDEGIHSWPATLAYLDVIVHIYAALGDEANVLKYGEILGRLVLANTGDDSDLKQLSQLEFYRKRSLWCAKKIMRDHFLQLDRGAFYMDMKHLRAVRPK